ncbi:MAG: lytic murein transglycosylase [Desulfobacterales bacterium]
MKILSCKKLFATAAFGLAMLFVSLPAGVQAGENNRETPPAVSGTDQPFRDWLEELRREAREEGISDETLDASLRGIEPVVRVIELDLSQPEFTQTFWSYLDRRVTEKLVERGRELLDQHRDLLDEIYREYGVPPRYIIAFWGMETNFGGHLGSFQVIEALATLAYNQRRSEFFRAELLDALKIIEQGHITPDEMKGSWAGAMGQMQFLPSTFNAHAVDYTGNGRKDIWGSLPDAFASAAKFLSDLGWHKGELWGREVVLPDDFDLRLASMETKKTVNEWSDSGVRRAYGAPLPEADMEGSVILPQGHDGPAFLVYNNFRVIMGWNRSVNYAIAVGHLADRIVGLPEIVNGRDASHEPLSRENIKEIQAVLNQLGYDANSEDGYAGSRTRTAIRNFQQEHSLPPDGYASSGLLKRLRKEAGD